jgi:hypothetical protein
VLHSPALRRHLASSCPTHRPPSTVHHHPIPSTRTNRCHHRPETSPSERASAPTASASLSPNALSEAKGNASKSPPSFVPAQPRRCRGRARVAQSAARLRRPYPYSAQIRDGPPIGRSLLALCLSLRLSCFPRCCWPVWVVGNGEWSPKGGGVVGGAPSRTAVAVAVSVGSTRSARLISTLGGEVIYFTSFFFFILHRWVPSTGEGCPIATATALFSRHTNSG